MQRMYSGLILQVIIFCIGLVSARADVTPLTLARGGATDYVIVMPADATAVDRYAARELAFYLRQITGAEFPVLSESLPERESPTIFVGLGTEARARLGGTDPQADLAPQEFVARNVGTDLFFYGNGVHGSLHATMDFLETSCGWRWYTIFEPPVLPSRPVLELAPFDRKGGFAYTYRKVDKQRGFDFYYQHGMNMGLDESVARFTRTDPEHRDDYAAFVSELPDAEAGVHTLFGYIPPDSEVRHSDFLPWLEKKDYFATNPEFFSMTETGKRMPNRQLCFSNPELRTEFTKNVLAHIAHKGEPCLLSVSAQDVPGTFCECPGCRALAERYESSGGPLYDYLFELCGVLAERHPGARIMTLAYRRAQTQKPPTLPKGEMLPANLIVDFAPIEDNYFADWTHPDPLIQETYADLKAWGAIVHPGNLWAWLYPNGYGTGYCFPVGNVERNITQIRLLYQAGVRGINTDQIGYHQRAGWSELHSYLLYKLWRDINCDTVAVIREFTDSQYGPAAERLRTYLAELEAGRKAMEKMPPGVNFHSRNFDDLTFPYLTVENMHRWQGSFDEMERLVQDGSAPQEDSPSASSTVGTESATSATDRLSADQKRWMANLRFARRQLDIATLWKWFDLKKAYPQAYADHLPVLERIRAANAAGALPTPSWEGKDLNRKPKPGPEPGDFATLIEAGGKVKTLPSEFDGIDPANIRQFVPRVGTWIPQRLLLLDPDGAFGYAVPVFRPDLPLSFGFYQADTKFHGARRNLTKEELVPGEYTLYKLGEITLTPSCSIWFSARSWATSLELGERLYEPGADNRWDAYVSLKCLGPTYGDVLGEDLMDSKKRDYQGLDPTDLVLVDRIILVRKGSDQFAAP